MLRENLVCMLNNEKIHLGHYLWHNLGVSGVAVCEEHMREFANREHRYPQGNQSTHYCHMWNITKDLTSNISKGPATSSWWWSHADSNTQAHYTTFAMKTLMHGMSASSMRWQKLISAMVSTRFRDTPKIRPPAAMQAWAMVKAGRMLSKRLEQSDSVPFSCTVKPV